MLTRLFRWFFPVKPVLLGCAITFKGQFSFAEFLVGMESMSASVELIPTDGYTLRDEFLKARSIAQAKLAKARSIKKKTAKKSKKRNRRSSS